MLNCDSWWLLQILSCASSVVKINGSSAPGMSSIQVPDWNMAMSMIIGIPWGILFLFLFFKGNTIRTKYSTIERPSWIMCGPGYWLFFWLLIIFCNGLSLITVFMPATLAQGWTWSVIGTILSILGTYITGSISLYVLLIHHRRLHYGYIMITHLIVFLNYVASMILGGTVNTTIYWASIPGVVWNFYVFLFFYLMRERRQNRKNNRRWGGRRGDRRNDNVADW